MGMSTHREEKSIIGVDDVVWYDGASWMIIRYYTYRTYRYK